MWTFWAENQFFISRYKDVVLKITPHPSIRIKGRLLLLVSRIRQVEYDRCCRFAAAEKHLATGNLIKGILDIVDIA